MEDLLILTDEKDEIIYHRFLGSLQTNEKTRSELLILAYGSIDVANDMLSRTSSTYIDSIDTHLGYDITLYVMPCGYKVIFVHAKRSNVRPFMGEVGGFFSGCVIKGDDVCKDGDIDMLYERFFPIY